MQKNRDAADKEEPCFQDYYADAFSHCYGCGRLNEEGLHVKSYWHPQEADSTVAHFVPKPYHTGGYPGFVYGGLIAAILDCHGNGTAAAAAYRMAGRAMGTDPNLRFVTASLKIDYKKPTPMGPTLELIAKIMEQSERKVRMDLSLYAEGKLCVSAEMLAVLLPNREE